MGAPQKHGQRSYKRYIATYDTAYARSVGTSQDFINNLVATGQAVNRGLRYNPNWGYLSRAYITETDTIYPNSEATSTVNNFYHKPLFSLRDFWSVNKNLYISNILYLSIGSGGKNSFSSSDFGNDTVSWQQELQESYDINMNIISPYRNTTKYASNIMRNGINNHFWLGLLSTFDYTVNKAVTVSGGLDLRTYRGEHYREVADLFGGNYTLDSGNKNESGSIKKYVGDKIGYHNDALIRWGGLFAQVKYIAGNWSVFGNVTASYSGYKRIDYFIPHTPGESSNETPWKYLPGFTVKGGANYNLNESMNVFANVGFISKAQRFNNVYDRGNDLFRDIKNEQVRAAELGYSFVKPRFTLNVNTYYTSWLNKPSDRAMRVSIDGEFHTININDMNARHMGIEFEFAWKIVDNLIFESLLSLGDWKWTSADTARVYDDNGQEIKDEARYFDARGLYVGDAAQFQNRESLRWEIIRGLYASGSFTWFGKHYAEFNPLDYDPDRYPGSFDEDGNPIQSWKIPNYYVIDFHAGYSWWIKKVGFQVRGSVINALDNIFITDAQNNDPFLTHSSTFDANSAGVFMGMGRRFTLSLRINL